MGETGESRVIPVRATQRAQLSAAAETSGYGFPAVVGHLFRFNDPAAVKGHEPLTPARLGGVVDLC